MDEESDYGHIFMGKWTEHPSLYYTVTLQKDWNNTKHDNTSFATTFNIIIDVKNFSVSQKIDTCKYASCVEFKMELLLKRANLQLMHTTNLGTKKLKNI